MDYDKCCLVTSNRIVVGSEIASFVEAFESHVDDQDHAPLMTEAVKDYLYKMTYLVTSE